MITSIFRKSTPFNFLFVVVLYTIIFFVCQYSFSTTDFGFESFFKCLSIYIALLSTILLTHYISNRNDINKDNGYIILLWILFLSFSISIFINFDIVISNLLVLFAIFSLFSIQNMKNTKQKIFDASMLILLASVFHFWSILFFILIFVSILFHVASDYRNWTIPFIAVACFAIMYSLLGILIQDFGYEFTPFQTEIETSINYFTDDIQRWSFSIFCTVFCFFLFNSAMLLFTYPLNVQPKISILLLSVLISVVIFIFSPNKTNDLFLFGFAPLATLGAGYLQLTKSKFRKELLLAILILISMFLYLFQIEL
jgi:hypothetical protein